MKRVRLLTWNSCRWVRQGAGREQQQLQLINRRADAELLELVAVEEAGVHHVARISHVPVDSSRLVSCNSTRPTRQSDNMLITKKAMQLAQRNVAPAFKFLLDRNTNLSRTWKRPEAVAHPKIWRRWTGRFKVADSTPVHFRVQDVPEELFETVVVHVAKGLRDEPMFAALGLWDDPASTRAMEELWLEMLQQRVSLVALVDDARYLRYLGTDNIIAGVNILGVVDKDSAHIVPKVEGAKARMFLEAMTSVERRVDVFARYGVSHYLTGMGLAVGREFRGLGVGTELLRGRLALGRALGVPLTVTLFSSPASHAIAHTVGMEVLSDVPLDRLVAAGRPLCPGARGSARLMAKRID